MRITTVQAGTHCAEQTREDAAGKESLAERRKAFNERYREWIAEQNRIVEEFGVFGEDERVW